ncbi:MAG: hypothetical protein IKI50_00295 [Clostridia bacterium]|nr:hypothetical protein [Clostridia bacterium]
MSEEVVRDNCNMPVGALRESGNQISGFSYEKGYVGFYNKSMDITFDAGGKIFCYGNGVHTLVLAAAAEAKNNRYR